MPDDYMQQMQKDSGSCIYGFRKGKKGFCLSCAVRKHMNQVPYCMDKIFGAKDYRKISKINSNNVERGNA